MFINKSLFVILIAFCSLTNASSSLMNINDNKLNGSEIQTRAVFCQNLFGIDVCVNVIVSLIELRVKFTIAGIEVFNEGISAHQPEICGYHFGLKACLNLSFPGTSVCFGVKGQVAILPAISVTLGCLDVGDLIHQILGKK